VIVAALVLGTGAVAFQGSTGTAHSQGGDETSPLLAQPGGRYHGVPSDFAGLNAPFRRNSWQAGDPRLSQATADLGAGAIRVFGGSTANYWNWRAGKFFDRRQVPRIFRRIGRRMKPIYLSDWARLVGDANASPVFDLNVVTSTLSEQLAMLHRARKLGMPIRRVELGNELYNDAPAILKAFPSPEAYGRKATRWIRAIKARFPGVQVAAAGLAGSRWAPPGTRGRDWTKRVLKTLRGESALTFHIYWRTPTGELSGKTLAAAFTAAIRSLNLLRAGGLSELPDGVTAWVTEWNVWRTSSLRGTWANGLSDAVFLLGLLGEPSVRHEDLQALIFREPYAALFAHANAYPAGPATVPFAPTAVGQMLAELYPALSGGARVSRLEVEHPPRIFGTGYPAVRGVAIEGHGALLVNLTGRRQSVQLIGAPPCPGTLDSIWAAPDARITGNPGEIRRETSSSQGLLSLPPRSVNRFSC